MFLEINLITGTEAAQFGGRIAEDWKGWRGNGYWENAAGREEHLESRKTPMLEALNQNKTTGNWQT